ncbi:MAG: hypothetical protein QXM93_08495 [Candidatus Methanomethyliaceae archaeon]
MPFKELGHADKGREAVVHIPKHKLGEKPLIKRIVGMQDPYGWDTCSTHPSAGVIGGHHKVGDKYIWRVLSQLLENPSHTVFSIYWSENGWAIESLGIECVNSRTLVRVSLSHKQYTYLYTLRS